MNANKVANDRVDLGFRQGTAIDPASLQGDDYVFPAPAIPTGDLVILLTQSCDILHATTEAEPYLEAVIGRQIQEFDGNYTRGKNPRVVQFACQCHPAHRYEVRIRERVLIRRDALAHARRAEGCTFSEDHISTLAFWFGRRFFRSAFPESFSKRVNQKQMKRLRKLIQDSGKLIDGIYIRFNTQSELEETEPYYVSIFVTVDPDDWSSDVVKQEAVVFASKFESILASGGIVIDTCEAVSNSEIDLYTIMNSLRLDAFDYLTFAQDEEAT